MIQTTTEFFEQGNFNNTIDMLDEFAETRIKQLRTYVVQFFGNRHEEVFNIIAYCGTDLEVAEKTIEDSKSLSYLNKMQIYAYLQTWENNLKINEKEIEL